MRKIFAELGISTCIGFVSYEVILSIQQSDFIGVAIGIGTMAFALLAGIDVASDPGQH